MTQLGDRRHSECEVRPAKCLLQTAVVVQTIGYLFILPAYWTLDFA